MMAILIFPREFLPIMQVTILNGGVCAQSVWLSLLLVMKIRPVLPLLINVELC